MATFLCHIKVRPGKEEAFEALAQSLFSDTHGQEAKCLSYDFFRAQDSGHYYALAVFEDYEAFLDHQSSDYHEAPDWPALLDGFRLEWIDPIPSASSFPASNPLERAADADETRAKYAGLFPIVVQDWWRRMRSTTNSCTDVKS